MNTVMVCMINIMICIKSCDTMISEMVSPVKKYFIIKSHETILILSKPFKVIFWFRKLYIFKNNIKHNCIVNIFKYFVVCLNFYSVVFVTKKKNCRFSIFNKIIT